MSDVFNHTLGRLSLNPLVGVNNIIGSMRDQLKAEYTKAKQRSSSMWGGVDLVFDEAYRARRKKLNKIAYMSRRVNRLRVA
jgi:hypothetical protein